MEACRINSCCTFIGAPVSSSHERYVWRNVCQPIPPYLPEFFTRAHAKACERRFRFSDPGYTRHQVPPRTSDIPPHSNPRGEDAASGSRWDSKADSFSDWQRPSLLPWAQLACSTSEQISVKDAMQRNIVLGVFGLDVIHPAVHETALNEKLVFVRSRSRPIEAPQSRSREDRGIGRSVTIVRHGSCSVATMTFELLHSER